MNLYTDIPYRNVNSGNLVKIKAINDEEVIYNYIEIGGAVGDLVTTVTNFMKHYEFVPPPVAPVDQRKECFACKEPIELGYEKQYKMAYYHKACLPNGKKNNAFLADNAAIKLPDLQQGDFCENYYKPTRKQVEALMAKPGKIIINEPVNISDLNFKIDKLNLELTKAHQLIGKLTLKLEQYK